MFFKTYNLEVDLEIGNYYPYLNPHLCFPIAVALPQTRFFKAGILCGNTMNKYHDHQSRTKELKPSYLSVEIQCAALIVSETRRYKHNQRMESNCRLQPITQFKFLNHINHKSGIPVQFSSEE